MTTMDHRRPKNISLPSIGSILDTTPLRTGGLDGHKRDRESWADSAPRTAPIPYSRSPLPTTPKQRRLVSAYPSPGSEEADGERYVYGSEGEKYVLESAMTPKWKVGDIFATTPVKTPSGECCSPMFVEYDPDKELGHTRLPEKQRPSELETRRSSESKAIVPTTPLTPSIVHYRPNGVLPARARRTSIASIGKKSNGEVKLVKWDRVSDKGTAPLNIEPRPPPVPRVCILCYIVKRKCCRTDGHKPDETHPCAACQKNNFACEFIKPSQLRDGKNPPTIEHLKLHTDQVQRLRTQELEERCARLEHALEMANLEGRVQQGYIANLKVYESVVNGYILQLKGRLYELDPRSRLLECRIPAMPEKRDDMEVDGGLILLSEAVDGISCFDCADSDMPVVEMDVDPPERR